MSQPTTKSTANKRKLNSSGLQTAFSKRTTFSGRIALTLGLALTLISNLNAQDEKTQYWQGVLDVGAAKLTMNVEIKKKNEKDEYSAVVYSVEQGNAKIPVDKVEVTDKKITLAFSSIKANFDGTLDKSGQVCKGTFRQNGKNFDLKLKRVKSFDKTEGKLIEYWKGSLNLKGTELKMGLKIFRMADGSLTGKT